MFKFLLLANFLALAYGNQLLGEWLNFKLSHDKNYLNHNEEEFRYKVYLENKATIEEHNRRHERGEVSYSLKMNQFGDLTDEEFHAMFLSPLNQTSLEAALSTDSVEYEDEEEDKEVGLPESVDWRLSGSLTPVKKQGPCGACWAFAATGAIEALVYRRTGKVIQLSEQNLLDCSSYNRFGNTGCIGGLMTYAYNYIRENGGVDTEESYPYEGKYRRCRFKRESVGATIKGYETIKSGDEIQMKKVVANISPVSVGIDGADISFRFYHQGVYYREGCAEEGLNHAVLVVGYGVDGLDEYWIARNSWGPGWGEQGYFRIARNKGNQCGIASLASYPVL